MTVNMQRNKAIQIEEVDLSIPAVQEELKRLYAADAQAHGGQITLKDEGAEHRFFARLPDVTDIVGMCALKRYPYNERHFTLVALTHPAFRDRGIATALTLTAIECAKRNPNIDSIGAMVKAGEPSERILKKLGFKEIQRISRPRKTYVSYELDTPSK